MYAECTDLLNDKFIFMLKPLSSIVQDRKFNYNNILITNTCKNNNIIINDDVTEIKIIDDGINKFDEEYNDILNNLPFTVEKIYLLYNIKKFVANLPYTIKTIYIYDICDISLIKVPFNCNIVRLTF
jgi:hypothetical protein